VIAITTLACLSSLDRIFVKNTFHRDIDAVTALPIMMLLLLLPLFPPIHAVYVGTILLPHGDFAYDPTFCQTRSREREVADNLAFASRTAARWIIDQHPDIVLLTTPHGLQLDYDYGIYHGRKGSGQVMLGQDLMPDGDQTNPCNSANRSPYNISLDEIDLVGESISNDLLQWLQPNYRVSAIYSPNDDTPIPLFGGELIPLLLLLQQSNQANLSLQSLQLPFQPLIWTFPHRRYQHSPEMVPELLAMGADMMTWIRQRPERIAVVVSGDLAHTHLSNGPYGYSNTSAIYDTAIKTWLSTSTGTTNDPCSPAAEQALLEHARSLQQSALSCGFTGYVLWHGMMRCHGNNLKDVTPRFRTKLLAFGNVTYYGMCSGLVEEIRHESKMHAKVSQRIVTDR
jgi:hypothetical protein